MKKLASLPSFHGDHQARKKVTTQDVRKKAQDEDVSDSEGASVEEEGAQEEKLNGEDRERKLGRSKSFKMRLLKKMGRGKEDEKKSNGKKDSSDDKQELKRRLEREKRKEEIILSYDKKAALESSSRTDQSTPAIMCGLNLPGYRGHHLKKSGTSSTNNRGRQGTGEERHTNPLLIAANDKERRSERLHRELRLGAIFSSKEKIENEERTKETKKEKRLSSFLHGAGFKRDNNAPSVKQSPKEPSPKPTLHPPSAGGSPWVRVDQPSGAAVGRRFDSGENDYIDRAEEGIDLMELQRRFQMVGTDSGVAPDTEEERRKARLAEDRIKGTSRLPWWGLNASSGKEGRRKEWERFFSGFKVSELWEDNEEENDDDDDNEDVEECRGGKVGYLTEETTVKEALDTMTDRGLNALPICLKGLSDSTESGDLAKEADASGLGGTGGDDELRERALRRLRKWRKAELMRERERKQRKQSGKTVLGWLDLRDLLTFAIFKFPRPPSADIDIAEVRRQGLEFTQHKIGELVNIYGMNGGHIVNDEGTGGQGRHRIAANDRMPAVFRMLRNEKGLRVLPVYDQSQLPVESRSLVRVLDTNAVVKWLYRVVHDNRGRSPFVRDLAVRQVRHWGAFADTILGKELIYFETEEMINNFDHFRASKRERRMSKLFIPFGTVDEGEGSTVLIQKGASGGSGHNNNSSSNGKKSPSPPSTPDHGMEKLDLNKHLFTISADRSVIDAFKIMYNYKVSALGVLEKKGKEKNLDDESSSDDDDSENDSDDSGDTDDDETSSDSSSDSESSSSESESDTSPASRERRKRDQEKARGPSLKEAKAMIEARESDDDDSSSRSESEAAARKEASSPKKGLEAKSPVNVGAKLRPPIAPRDSVSLHDRPTRSQSDPQGLGSMSKRASAHDASDTAKTRVTAGSKDRLSRPKKSSPPSSRLRRQEMVVRSSEAGRLISHLSSSDLKHFEPFAMMRCLHMSIKEYLTCYKEKKPLVTCRRDTTLLQLLEKMAREQVNRVWLLADEDDDSNVDLPQDENHKGHERKKTGTVEANGGRTATKSETNSGRPIGMISLADIMAEVTRL